VSLLAIVGICVLVVIVVVVSGLALVRAFREARQQEEALMWSGSRPSSRPVPPDATAQQAVTPPADPKRRLAERLELPDVPFDFVKLWRSMGKKGQKSFFKWSGGLLLLLVVMTGGWAIDSHYEAGSLPAKPKRPARPHLKYHASKSSREKARVRHKRQLRKYHKKLKAYNHLRREHRRHVHVPLWWPLAAIMLPFFLRSLWRCYRRRSRKRRA
jgi:hypothetical protein